MSITVASILISSGATSIEKPYVYSQEVCENGSNCTDFRLVLLIPSNEGRFSRDVDEMTKGAQENEERESR